MVQDLGVARGFGTTELPHRFPALSSPCANERHFRTSRGTEPIRGPFAQQEVRVGLAQLRRQLSSGHGPARSPAPSRRRN